MTISSEARSKRTLLELLREMLQPKVAVMVALGFSSGLPFLLTANTFSYWLRDDGTSLTAIGFISWIGFAYAFKVYWAPLVDKVRLPLLGRLGQRRGWMFLCQLLVAAGLIGMAMVGTEQGLMAIGVFALITAFASATLDIAIDAWRIEAASDSEEVGLMTSAAQLGYRIAHLIADALVIAMAARIGWSLSYVAMGVLMMIGIAATLFAIEPVRVEIASARKLSIWSLRGMMDAVIGPFIDFFVKHKTAGVVMLLMIALYRLPDFIMGPMYNPFYVDLGLTKDTVAYVRGTFGLGASFVGVVVSGFSIARLGMMPTLIIGLGLQGASTAAFALLSLYPESSLFAAVMVIDNFASTYAGVALITYMSSLTSIGYTATQYALLSSTYALLGKFLKGFSGATVEALTPTYGLLGAYATAFISTGLTAILPAILLIFLWRMQGKSGRGS